MGSKGRTLLIPLDKSTRTKILYTCPCCGYRSFEEPPGSYDICEICDWDDDYSQLRFVYSTGANRLTLVDAQLEFLKVAGSRPDATVKKFVRDD